MYLKNHKTNFWTALILFCAFPYFPASFAQPENILLNHDISCFQGNATGTKERSPVMFTHETHMEELECLDCHHLYKNGENVLDESDLEEGNPNINCCSCHNSTTKINLENAFHSSCIPCHNENSKKFWIPRKGIQWKAFITTSDQQAPTLCGECHVLAKSMPPK